MKNEARNGPMKLAQLNLKPFALSLSKGMGLRQAQPERIFQGKTGRLNKGFTLLEVLVALAILALALMAALRAGTVAAQNAEEIRLRQLAEWVARDRLEEHRGRRAWFPVGSHSGEIEQGGIRFRWEEKITPTPNAQFRRVDVRVHSADAAKSAAGSDADDTHALARLTGFLVKPGG